MRPKKLALAVALGLLPVGGAVAATQGGCVLSGFSLGDGEADGGPGGASSGSTSGGNTTSSGSRASSGTGTGTGTGTGGMKAAPVCEHASYPDPPVGNDDHKTVGTIVVAIHSIDIGDGTTIPGYDLDGVCTCFGDAGRTCQPAALTNPLCDADGGIDNAAAGLLSSPTFSMVNLNSATLSKEAESGTWSLIIRIDGYNGEPNDPKVDVAVFPSQGVDSDAGTPTWDGNDPWFIESVAVGDGGLADPAYSAQGAYVADGTLVAAIPSFQLLFAGAVQRATLNVTAGVLTGKLTKSKGRWSIQNGVIAGSWRTQDVFKTISSYRDDNGNPYCANNAAVNFFVVSTVCNAADILAENGSKSESCDALSFGLGYKADPARIGPVVQPGIPTKFCGDAGDFADASCAE